MIYEYRCKRCNSIFEVYGSIKDPVPEPAKCPVKPCKGRKADIVREYSPPHLRVADPQTLGTLAERNTVKHGRRHIENVEREYEREVKEAKNTPCPTGGERIVDKPEHMRKRPSWVDPHGKTHTINKVNLDKIKDVKKYIRTGKG